MLYIFMCVFALFVRRFLTCLLFGFFVKNTKVYASRQWSMEREEARGRWAGGNSQGSPPSESTVLCCCCCCWTFRAIQLKLWRWQNYGVRVCERSVCAKCVWQSDATPGQEHRLHMTHPLCECCITRERRDSEEIWIRFDFCVKVIRFKAVGGSEGSEV